jgi:hypothetical protein
MFIIPVPANPKTPAKPKDILVLNQGTLRRPTPRRLANERPNLPYVAHITWDGMALANEPTVIREISTKTFCQDPLRVTD